MIIPNIFHPYSSEIFTGFCGAPENFSDEFKEHAQKNIEKIVQDQNIFPEKILNPKQTHSKNLTSEENFHLEDECDGVFTSKKNVLCMVKTADCIGAIFYYPEQKRGATIHAGWKGLEKKICTAFLQKFPLEENKNCVVALSPSLGPCCSEFSDPYHETPDFFHPYIFKKQNKYFVDLWEIAKQELLDMGIQERNIEMPFCCTKCGKGNCSQEKFWSHRNGEKERNATFFMRK